MSYIQFEGINKYFGENHVLKDVTLGVEQNELVTLLGPSGCGKSTLLRCLAGLETVDGGKIFLDGVDITGFPPQKRNIGMVFQQYSLFPNMTARQNVAFGLQIAKVPGAKIKEMVDNILELVDLRRKADSYPSRLSGGQQQRVALARALVMEPKVLLLDEPLSAIDALLRRNLQIEIRRIQKALKITTIFVTHDQDEAMVMSDTIHLLNCGEIEQSGSPVSIYTAPETKFAATFIGNYNVLPAADIGETVGASFDGSDVAIRPEVIEISASGREPREDEFSIGGVIESSITKGNIIRYSVNCGKFLLSVDVLFDRSMLFNEGDEVRMCLKKENCLPLH